MIRIRIFRSQLDGSSPSVSDSLPPLSDNPFSEPIQDTPFIPEKRRRSQKIGGAIPPSPKPETLITENEESNEKTFTGNNGEVYTIPDWLLHQKRDLPVPMYSKGRSSLIRTGSDYLAAGFPQELVDEASRQNDAIVQHKRKGAQYAVSSLSEQSMRGSMEQAKNRLNAERNEEKEEPPAAMPAVPPNPFIPLRTESSVKETPPSFSVEPEPPITKPVSYNADSPRSDNGDEYAAPLRLNRSKPSVRPEQQASEAQARSSGWQVITDDKPERGSRQAHRHAVTPESSYENPYATQLPKRGYAPPTPPAAQPAPGTQSVPAPNPETEEAPKSSSGNRYGVGLGIVTAALILACLFAIFTIGKQLMSIQDAEKSVRQIKVQRQNAFEESIENHPFRYRELIEKTAKRYNLMPAFVAAIVLNESSFRTDATSSVGARGLMQLMDDTAGWIYGKIGSGGYSFDDLYTAETNIEYGCWYLNYLSSLFHGDPILVAASFHAGQGEISNWLNDSRYSKDGRTIALSNMPEGPTRTYVGRILRDFAEYQNLYYVLNVGGNQ